MTHLLLKGIAVPGLLFLLASPALAQVPIDRGAIDLMPGLSPEVRNKCIRALRQKNAGPLEARLKKAGLTDAQVERLRNMPRGPLRQSRYNHGVVLEAPGLDDAQRRTLVRLVAAADAAQLSLASQKQGMARALKDADELVRSQALGRFDQHVREIDRRFWRVAYYALSADQMRAVRELLAPRSQHIPQLREQMFALPGLTASQGSRIAAAFAEHEAERAADQALARRLQAERGGKEVTAERRKEIQRELGAAYRRLHGLNEAFRARLLDILTDEQRDALRSAPPVLNQGERSRPPFELTRGMAFRKERAVALRELRRKTNAKRKAIQKELRGEFKDSGLEGAMMGSDSPQSMTMNVMRRGAQGRVWELYREAGRELVTRVMTPRQVTAWVAWAP